MIKVVFDTVVFVSSLIKPHNWWGKIIFQHASKYRLFVSKTVLEEIFEVLQRPEMTSLFHTLEGLDKEKTIEIVSQAEVVEIPDRDRLDLKGYEGIKIIDAETFLRILEEEK